MGLTPYGRDHGYDKSPQTFCLEDQSTSERQASIIVIVTCNLRPVAFCAQS